MSAETAAPIELGSKEFWEALASNPALLAHKVCEIDLVNLETTLQHHASLYAWVSATHESAAVAEERAKWEVTKAEAKAMLVLKELPDPHTQKPKTVQVLLAEVNNYKAVQEAVEKYLAAQEKRGALQAMTKALSDRRDMLVQIAAKHREERRTFS